jgi:hypothetical protein
LLKVREAGKQIAAIIVSFSSGSSYDDLFSSVEQKTMEGSQVLVYACSATAVTKIFDAMREKPSTDDAQDLLRNMKEVHPDCVVFNWECSSSYGDESFSEGVETVFAFLRTIIDAGHMAMFSDFSLKALIKNWD